jgi:hypothetical protein
MIKSLVGYTGFVGSNLASQVKFDGLYNSKNIEEAFDSKPDLLVYSGVRAKKYLANKDPENDFAIINEAIDNIKKIQPNQLVLISTIDVYKIPVGVDEDTVIDTNGLLPYGLNRHYLEKWAEENIEDHLVVRLPGLYGKNIKKNFIFDLINIIPSALTEAKFTELCKKDDFIESYYTNQDNGFYKCKDLSGSDKNQLKEYFNKIGFSALNFTDSRGIFQFYNLSYLWNHIEIALNNGIKKINFATEPVRVSELYKYIKNSDFVNEIAQNPPVYDYKTKHFKLFGGNNGYILNENFVLRDIKDFVEKESK